MAQNWGKIEYDCVRRFVIIQRRVLYRETLRELILQ